MIYSRFISTLVLAASFSSLAFNLHAQAIDTLDPALRTRIDSIAADVLKQTGVPSASVAIVKGGKLVYTHAYGKARLDPSVPATADMRYSIGSISKQFTATAILLLQEQGKLSLDDAVGKYVPGLTRGDEVTIRQILSHTSGYQDYWPEDYLMASHAQAGHPAADPRHLGQQAARLRARHAMAVLQYQLRHRRPHRRKSHRRKALRFSQRAHLSPARNEKSVMELRRERSSSSDATPYMRARARSAPPGAERRPAAGCLRPANWP